MRYILLLLLLLLLFSANSYGQSPEDTELDSLMLDGDTTTTIVEDVSKDRGKNYEKDEKRLLKYLEEKKYKSLMRLSAEMVKKFPDEGIPKYCYAMGLYGLIDKNQFQKTYERYRMQYWRMIALQLRKSKKLNTDTELVKSSWPLLDGIQNDLWVVAEKHMKLGNDKNMINYLTMIMQVYDERRGVYKNNYQGLIQDKVFARAKNNYETGKMEAADGIFNWLDKFFYKSKFPYRYAGLATWKDSYYQFEEWSHSKYHLANTGSNVEGLDDKEKQIVFLQNLVRMNPELFLNTFLKKYLERYPSLTGNAFVSTLRKELEEKSPLVLLHATVALGVTAEAHNETLGAKEGVRAIVSDSTIVFAQQMRGLGTEEIISENCYYGSSDKPEDVVIGLLINIGVTPAVHRKAMLNKNYTQIGVAVKPNTIFNMVVALDYSTGDKESRSKSAKEKEARDQEAVGKAAREQLAKDQEASNSEASKDRKNKKSKFDKRSQNIPKDSAPKDRGTSDPRKGYN